MANQLFDHDGSAGGTQYLHRVCVRWGSPIGARYKTYNNDQKTVATDADKWDSRGAVNPRYYTGDANT